MEGIAMSPGEDVEVSVVIPAYNEEENIGPCLEGLKAQDHPSFEVIVVDDGSKDDTYDMAFRATQYDHRFGLLRLEDNMGVSHAKNIGARNAGGSILAFLDADCVPENSWLSRIIGAMKRKRTLSVTGSMASTRVGATNRQRTVHDFYAGWERAGVEDGFASFIHGGNFAIERELFVSSGGFDEDLPSKEDRDLHIRLAQSGQRVAFAEDAIVNHSSHKSLADTFHQSTWYARGAVKLAEKYGNPLHRLPGFGELIFSVLGILALIILAIDWSILGGRYAVFLLLPPVVLLALSFWRDAKGLAGVAVGRRNRHAFTFGLARHLGEKNGYLRQLLSSTGRGEKDK
jgi:glycosyltransferase involved in cell wall biosynthesis